MAASIEIEKPQVPVTEIPDQPEISKQSELEGVEVVQGTPSAVQVQKGGDQAQQVTPVPAPPAASGPSITIPSDQTALTQMSKGNTTNASTGWALYWIRQIKKALKKHWFVLVLGNQNNE